MTHQSAVPAESDIGLLYMHSTKAVKRGEPANRVFAVVDVVEDNGRKYLLAWKCELVGGGVFSENSAIHHPAYKRSLAQDDPRLFCKAIKNGAEPTALFRPDSFYRVVGPLRR